ncbi:hypothetical protein MCOR25_005515 [Pyricularia grisea]|uniref:Uncharacterized protein n=1 Tax=Pyricularia grisea TaxID=148305 RepID=A0A6P8AZG1_PYRGI|nr:hypothetical protein PgNI_10179 [Pyricularia grisea]KAI6365023.1 hypothetical protein MCOR25_005515 [Pyricularia grisea]TLD07778.1 hypothetical protein PgNI_10179 [Pyricularia grisea]
MKVSVIIMLAVSLTVRAATDVPSNDMPAELTARGVEVPAEGSSFDKGNTLKHVRYRRSKSSSKKSGGRKSSSHFPRSKSSSSKSGKKKSGSRSSLGDVCYKDSKLVYNTEKMGFR